MPQSCPEGGETGSPPAASINCAMKLPGAIYTVNTKLCTRDDGTVSSVAILRSSDQPMVDAAVLSALFPRLYDPYRQSGKAIPFCHPVQTTFNVGSGRQR